MELVVSVKPIASASELFFAKLSIWLIKGGNATRNACGKMTNRYFCTVVRARALPASS